mmetsp:Transcript_32544/g.37908  ORF Transcript_32544/g.37908 Transcript_32544/m.37908 type:complete len:431 (+) Transcript_32544:80-1372(+)
MSSIPAVISGVAIYQLISSGTLDILTAGYFNLPIPSQVAILAILFATVFIAVSISQFIEPATSIKDHDHDHTPPKHYPLTELSKCANDKQKFMTIFPMLRDEMLSHMKNNEMIPEALEWCKTMMDYNVPKGKLNRGLTVIGVQRTLMKASSNRDLNEKEIARASVLGWAIEFLQAFFLVADDIMDESVTRRGQPCWYKLDHVKSIAINDSFLLESYVFTMIKEHFGEEEYYLELVELFLDVIQKTEFGQLLDLTSGDEKVVDLNRFTMERYQKIVKYKTAFYTFYLPVAIGMITSGVKDKSAFVLAKSICCQIGEYFQIQDDFLDCFGDPKTIGKVGTDIQDNKCSWMVLQALERVDKSQRELVQQNYGQWDDAKVAKIKELYKTLDLASVYEKYEETFYNQIQKDLAKVSLMPREVFDEAIKKIYKRKM